MNDRTECTLAKGFSLWEKVYAQSSFFAMRIRGVKSALDSCEKTIRVKSRLDPLRWSFLSGQFFRFHTAKIEGKNFSPWGKSRNMLCSLFRSVLPLLDKLSILSIL